ncbi:RNA polymerase sigma factor [Leptospira sp. SA-E8]|uniref:RNA polymerase sigma factor n=1 Tax=Leptospira sp. SA-E8 TaxID=3422259 RepID=UPI003EB6CC3B
MSYRSHPTSKSLTFLVLMQYSKLISETYEKSKKALFVYFYSLTGEKDIAEDLLQEVFLVFSKDPQKFDPRKGSFYSWGSVVGRNLFYGQLRKTKKETIRESEDMENFPSKYLDPQSEITDRMEESGRMLALQDCISRLASEDQSLVREKFQNGSTLERIGEKLGITKRSVSRRYAEILKRLRFCLETKGVGL